MTSITLGKNDTTLAPSTVREEKRRSAKGENSAATKVGVALWIGRDRADSPGTPADSAWLDFTRSERTGDHYDRCNGGHPCDPRGRTSGDPAGYRASRYIRRVRSVAAGAV